MVDIRIVEINGKEYRFRPDERLLFQYTRADGELAGWQVWEYRERSTSEWVSLKVFDARSVRQGPRRRVYQVGWSIGQDRAARNRSWLLLIDDYPEVAHAVESRMRDYMRAYRRAYRRILPASEQEG